MGSTIFCEKDAFPAVKQVTKEARSKIRFNSKPVKKFLVDRDFMREQVLVELLSASATEPILWARLEERLVTAVIYPGCFEKLIRELIVEKLIRQNPSEAFALIELTKQGIQCGQACRRELFEKFWRARKHHPKRAEFFWRRQLLRMPVS